MNITTRTKLLTTIIGIIAVLGIIAQSTGVLAAWNDKVWGNSSFGRAAVVEGYARSVTAQTITDRLFSKGEFTATRATHTHDNPGTTVTPSATGWHGDSSGGLFALGAVSAEGRSSASYTTTSAETVASSESRARKLVIAPREGSFMPLVTTDNGDFAASVSCRTTDGGAAGSTTVTAPSGTGRFRLGVQSFAIPAPGATRNIYDYTAGFYVTGSLKSVATKTSTRALSTLILDLELRPSLNPLLVWTVTVQLVRAECGIGVPLPDVSDQTGVAALARQAPSSSTESSPESSSEKSTSAESSPAESSGSESSGAEISEGERAESGSSESESSQPESADTHGTEAENDSTTESSAIADEEKPVTQGPTTPTGVSVGRPFSVIATDGTDLGTATIQQIESNAPEPGAPATVAVKMSIRTSDATGDHRLSSVSWRDFVSVVGGVEQSVGAASTTAGSPLPQRLEPGQTYTGWVTFTVPGAAGRVMWRPDGTTGWTFVLPEPTVPSSTSASPAPVKQAPETTEPETGATDEASTEPQTAPSTTESAETPDADSSAPSEDSSSDEE